MIKIPDRDENGCVAKTSLQISKTKKNNTYLKMSHLAVLQQVSPDEFLWSPILRGSTWWQAAVIWLQLRPDSDMDHPP